MKNLSGFYIAIISICTFLLPETLALAQDSLNVPDIIGNLNNPYILPASGEPGFWFSAGIGLAAGLLSSSIGAGGGMIVVPALMSTGIAGIYAIGSEIFRLFIFGTIQSTRMGLNKRIHYPLAACLATGTILGGLGGYKLTKTVFMADPAGSDVFVSSMIALWLVVYSFIIIPEFREAAHDYALDQLRKEKEEQERELAIQVSPEKPEKPEKNGANKGESRQADKNKQSSDSKTEPNGDKPGEQDNNITPEFEDELYPDEEPWPIARTLRTINLPPFITFPGTIKDKEDELEPDLIRRGGHEGGDELKEKPNYERIPLLPAVLLSIAGGFFMALTGSGGIVLSFTILTKGFGCVAALVAGTDLARLALSSGFLTMSTYGLNGFINIYCITGLVFGTSCGLHLGSKSLKQVQPYRIKGLIALLVVSVIINRLLALPYLLIKAGASIPASLAATLDQSGNWILFIGAATYCGWMLYAFAWGMFKSLTPPEERNTGKPKEVRK